MTTNTSTRRTLVASFVAALIVGGVVVFVVVRSRDAAVVTPEPSTAKTGASKEVAEVVEHGDAAPPLLSVESAAKRGDVANASTSSPDSTRQELPPPTARFRGRLVYESTREGVPWCIVAVRVPGERGVLRVTDDDGHFTVPLDAPATTLDVLAWDSTELPREWDGAQTVAGAGASNAEIEIAVRMWPTIVIDTGLPSGADVGALEFEFPGMSAMHGGARTTRSGLVIWRGGALLRDDDGWFQSLHSAGPPWQLTIEDPKSAWHCGLELDHFDGVVHVSPQWKRYGALAVKLGTNLSKPPAWKVSLSMRPIKSGMRARDSMSHEVDLMLGSCTLEKLEPGERVLEVTSSFCERAEVPVTIRDGETTRVAVTLACLQPAGSIRGVVRSESGTLRGVSLDAQLASVDSRRGSVGLSDFRWTQEGKVWVARFEFRSVPSGAYSVDLTSDSKFAIRPEQPISAHPGEEVEFTLLDGAPTIDLGFRVFDKSSGAELDGFDIDSHRLSLSDHMTGVASGTIVFTELPVNGNCSWSIFKAGYTCVSDDLESVSHAWTVDGRKRWVRVELERGARVTVRVYGGDGAPLAGATVVIDGRDAGLTDEHGDFSVLWSTTPTTIDARYLNWRHSRSNYSKPFTGHFSSCWSLRFTLEPP